MQFEVTLWGRKQGEDAIEEKVITSTSDSEHLRKAREWAVKNGYTVLRESRIDGTLPSFAEAINI